MMPNKALHPTPASQARLSLGRQEFYAQTPFIRVRDDTPLCVLQYEADFGAA
jgi:hypothetical protein